MRHHGWWESGTAIRRTRTRLLAMTAALLVTTGCGLAYLPGEEAAKAQNVTDESALRRQLVLSIASCDRTGASGTLRNRSTRVAKVVIEVAFVGAKRPTNMGDVSVRADSTVDWTIPAPNDADPSLGCEPSLRTVAFR